MDDVVCAWVLGTDGKMLLLGCTGDDSPDGTGMVDNVGCGNAGRLGAEGATGPSASGGGIGTCVGTGPVGTLVVTGGCGTTIGTYGAPGAGWGVGGAIGDSGATPTGLTEGRFADA